GMSDIIDIYRMRRIIQPSVIAGADALHPALSAASSSVEDGEAGITAMDWQAVGTANMNYHIALMTLSDSPRLVHAFRNLMAVLRLVFLRMGQAEQLHQPFVALNSNILVQLRKGNTREATELMESYLDTSEDTLLAAYTRRGFE